VNLGSQVISAAVNDAPISPMDASANANRTAVMQMICMYVAESTIHRISDPLKWRAENGAEKLASRYYIVLVIPPTSVHYKCFFSGAGFIYSDSRSCLHPAS